MSDAKGAPMAAVVWFEFRGGLEIISAPLTKKEEEG
jgi:hypothetical protein